MPELSTEAFAQEIDGALLCKIDELVATLLNDDLSRFFETAYVPVDGAEHSIIRLRFNPARLDAELCAAMRANGFNID